MVCLVVAVLTLRFLVVALLLLKASVAAAAAWESGAWDVGFVLCLRWWVVAGAVYWRKPALGGSGGVRVGACVGDKGVYTGVAGEGSCCWAVVMQDHLAGQAGPPQDLGLMPFSVED